MRKKVIITGASGMTGKLILNLCLNSHQISEVCSLVRRSSGTDHPKLKEVVVKDFLDYTGVTEHFKNIDIAFCCIGVYTGAVPRDQFRVISTDIPVAFGKMVHQHSPEAKYCFLSGSGADRTEKSRMIFAVDKGAAENQLSAMGFRAFHTFRPGYIYPVTKRKEPNFTYRLSRTLYPLIQLFGKNASIKSTELAQAMFNVGMNDHIQKEEFENREILEQL